ncbi:MAG: ABC transporter [Bdellovibrionaceae bacterium]|nr:ABC transporter [Pseudobdellovibrionaceae bacterium]|tara:strand:- start:13092 stop:14819 length:1728 start_codon:yes stop_codon:yes gene_type:complete
MKNIISVIWPELKPYFNRILFIISLGIVVSGLRVLVPHYMQVLTDAWMAGKQEDSTYIPWIIAVVFTVSAFIRYFQMYWMKFIAEQVSVKLRKDLMQKYLYLNLSYLQKFVSGTGGLISRMISDIQVIQVGTQRISDLVREPFMALFAFAYMVWVDWKLVLFVFITFPIAIVIINNLSRSIRKYSHKSLEFLEDISKTLKESLDGTRIVQSYNLQETMGDKFNAQSDQFLDSRRKIISREELVGPASETLFAITMAMILAYIGTQIFANKLTVADFLGFSFAIGMLGDAVKKIQSGYVKLQQSTVALKRYKDVLDKGDQVEESDNPKPFPADWQSIEFKNVCFSYGSDQLVLNNINLKIKRGEVVALVGGSGGGKSTFVNLIGRFFEPNSGEIFIDGINIRDFSLKDLRTNIGLVSQDVFLFSDTIKFNIHAGDFTKSDQDIETAAEHANAHKFISEMELGYETIAGERGTRLSGGQKQRISIARAILKDAPILILDEATSALDSESEKEVQKGLAALMQGRTTFVIAHRLSTITHADRILVLEKGQIVEEGRHSELVEKPDGYYKRLVDLQGSI